MVKVTIDHAQRRSMRESRWLRCATVSVLAMAMLAGGATPVVAHLGAGLAPARTVALVVVGVRTTTDVDDGLDDNAEIYVKATVHHLGHSGAVRRKFELSDDYDWDTYGGGFQAVNVQLWAHVECDPPEPVDLQFHAYEEDDPGVDDDLGVSPLETFLDMTTHPGEEFTRNVSTAGGTGVVELKIRAQAKPAPSADQQCATTSPPIDTGVLAFTGSMIVNPALSAPGGPPRNGTWSLATNGVGAVTDGSVGTANMSAAGDLHVGDVGLFGDGALCGLSGGSQGTGAVFIAERVANLDKVGWSQSAATLLVLDARAVGSGPSAERSLLAVLQVIPPGPESGGWGSCSSGTASGFTIVGVAVHT